MARKMPKFIAQKEPRTSAKGPGPMYGGGHGADTAEGRGMFKRKARKVKNNKPIARYSGKA